MEKTADKETPLMRQYNAFKAQYPGALLLFRVGDFYETFGEDAVITSKILDIVLTKRSNGAATDVALAGFPHHALDTYLPKLIRAGQRVAICDQLEDPKFAKGLVKRGVTEMVTPGVSFHDNILNVKRNNYLASVFLQTNKSGKMQGGIAFLDITTGEFLVAEGEESYLEKLMQSFQPSEVLFSKAQKDLYESLFKEDFNTFRLEDWIYGGDFGYEKLLNHFGTNSLKGFGIEHLPMAIAAAGAILHYLELTEHREWQHITSISRIEEEKYVWLDKFTIRNLELLFPQHEGGVPFINILDKTLTSMGARLMRKWVLLPLKDLIAIEQRLEMVNFLLVEENIRQKLHIHLQAIGDLERIMSKIVVGRINPREIRQLSRSLKEIQPIKLLLQYAENSQARHFGEGLQLCETLVERIEKTIQEHPPLQIHQGGIVKEGVNAELDEIRQLTASGKDYLEQIQQREIQRTGISSLKIDFNKVFGYYLEVRHTHKDKVPSDWIRKQTLTNAERYITEELKIYEEKILSAEERMNALEQKIFLELVSFSVQFLQAIQQNAQLIAQLDCLNAFAEIAEKNKYQRPQLSEDNILNIKEGRHPVIEQQLPLGEQYVPNDVYLDNQEQQIIIITGPNMAGKSALLRQTALIVLMAQMGSFVPAKEAHIGLVDKIFTRVGASDNLSQGESTFMVEMTETASILHNLSPKSLVLMDEIGRGTSTYDGISIAWAIVEYLHNHPTCRPRTLFATHYHELNELANDLARVKNFNVAVKEVAGKVVFLRKLKEGGSEHSFGIHVAQLAGIPSQVIFRANEVLNQLEQSKGKEKRKEQLKHTPKYGYQMNLFAANDPYYEKIMEILKKLDINTLSPVEALLKLNELKKWAEK
ncbi:MAG: DNA mismatch repair protein MutS [Flammeovirgaceae bacterium]